ncbi:TetR/AcrR family transcriptional regulator [Curtobacterium sp. 458]|uniref:TetR/AcrR family transcriptional regulator n=1 Tax=Curtobacterium sp. 458 TaxID=3050069 RepID=UPI0025B3BD50|nr:TetR/AcrR family transcriptional regulator [Curtobacterium sp. 458]WJY00743.1 TetR/AcrR family transcriptional regulator [Curtobacterium sp. 458]
MPRTRDDAAQRARLSDAVFTTIAELGPTGLTLRAVAERAGCTTGLVLHTFPDKRALLLHARDVLHERTRARAEQAESTAADPAAAVRAVALGALATDADRAAEARVWVGFLAAALGDPVLAERHATNARAFTERLARLIGTATGLPADTSAARAASLGAAVEGVTALAAGDPDHWTPARQTAALDVVLRAALAPEPDPAD